MLTAEIYPPYNARYYSHFVDTIEKLIGPRRVRFTTRDFPRFGPNCLAFRVGGAGGVRRFYLHAQDPADIDAAGLEWCDVFAKVNLDPADAGGRVVPLGPIFPFRFASPFRGSLRGVRTYVAARGQANALRKHLGDHRGQSVTRFPVSAYRPTEADPDYIFYNASIWEFEKEGNEARARFIEASRTAPGIRFEGGLFPRDSVGGEVGWKAPEFREYLGPRYSALENLEKSRRSLLTMNNPSCLDCHSWRFAEQLALGKAILCTPLRRAVPAPLLHGEHVHYVDGSVESFREAIQVIAADPAYRQHLERGARRYFDDFISPPRAIARVLSAADIEIS